MIVEEWVNLKVESHIEIILPLIRKIEPSLIASDLVGVQPMPSLAGGVFSTLRSVYGNIFYELK